MSNYPKWLKKLTTILASVLLLTMFGLGGYWLGARQQRSSPIDLLTTPKPSWFPTATPDQQLSTAPTIVLRQTNQIANWKTYKHEGYGFLIQYPPNLQVVDQRTDFVSFFGESIYGSHISIVIEPAYYKDSPEKQRLLLLNVGEKLYIGKSSSSERYITRIHDRKIGGQPAYQFKLVEECNKDGRSCSAGVSKSTIWYVYFRGKGDYYSILMDDKGSEYNLVLFDKIVSTLKVIQ